MTNSIEPVYSIRNWIECMATCNTNLQITSCLTIISPNERHMNTEYFETEFWSVRTIKFCITHISNISRTVIVSPVPDHLKSLNTVDSVWLEPVGTKMHRHLTTHTYRTTMQHNIRQLRLYHASTSPVQTMIPANDPKQQDNSGTEIGNRNRGTL